MATVNEKMTALADAIRSKTGLTGTLTLDGMIDAANSIEPASDPVLQSKTVTPSTSFQTVTPDSGYDGLSEVTVNAMPTATQATPTVSIDSAGKITASATQTAGYVAAGTKSGTKQLTTQAAKTITPSKSSQTAVASGVYTTGAITVGAIPSTYVKPTATKAATTYTPSASNQTIAAGTYCSGAQTIKGDANLVAGNIKSGVSIFGVSGNYEGGSGGSSGGGSVETCVVDLASPYDLELAVLIYSDGNSVIDADFYTNTNDRMSLTVAKNSILFIESTNSFIFLVTEGNAEVIHSYGHIFLVNITGDCSIDAEM